MLLKKTIKLTLGALACFKAGDLLLSRTPEYLSTRSAAAERYEDEDLVANMMKEEFTGDLAKAKPESRVKYDVRIRPREEQLKELMDPTVQYDLLIVGGGANGAGVALEAASRGLKCAVVDMYDFSAGTSSRSTKMAHGGLRYFEQMMKLEGDPFESFNLLKETLHERNYFVFAAPYLNKQLQLLVPSTFLQTLFLYYPGALGYHLLYLS